MGMNNISLQTLHFRGFTSAQYTASDYINKLIVVRMPVFLSVMREQIPGFPIQPYSDHLMQFRHSPQIIIVPGATKNRHFREFWVNYAFRILMNGPILKE